MRNPEFILNGLAKHHNDAKYLYERLYRILYNKEMYYLAYIKLAPNMGNMTEGTDSKTIDGFSLGMVDKLIESIKDKSYQPKPVRRTYIPKKNGKKRPLGIPAFADKLVQEVIKMILEAIYEGRFSNQSHGFRPQKSCHTALHQIKNSFVGVRWFVEGDIKGFFDNIDHHIMISILRKNIKDEYFIGLIWKFLRAGYMKDWKFNKTFSGTPQGGIISPILSNIYLNELDVYMEKYRNSFNSGKERKRNPEYRSFEGKSRWLRKKMEATKDNAEIERLSNEIKMLRAQMVKIPYYEQMDASFKRLAYVRYADDFIIGVIGSQADAEIIKKDIKDFLERNLKIELSEEKTLITHSKKKAGFLGYNIHISREQSLKPTPQGVKRTLSWTPMLTIPQDKWRGKLLSLGALQIQSNNSWKPMHRKFLTNLDDLEIIETYNSEIRGFYQFYKMASNTNVLNKFKYIMEYSIYKTFANKYRTSMGKILKKYKHKGIFSVPYETKKGAMKRRAFYSDGFPRAKLPEKTAELDSNFNPYVFASRNSLIEKLKAKKCEWCNDTEVKLEMHHVRKLKDLKGKAKWEFLMIARRRKTLALCEKCHVDLHAGRLG